MVAPERGDLVYVDFDAQSGREQAGIRPAIVLSPKQFNQITGFTVLFGMSAVPVAGKVINS